MVFAKTIQNTPCGVRAFAMLLVLGVQPLKAENASTFVAPDRPDGFHRLG